LAEVIIRITVADLLQFAERKTAF